ncbi:MAG: sn-glycerol-1-phosphate dehydrogenase [Clostridiales bacterium]|nr:sn-glycerol-1-phosphate dehydrogenase [Clostridiales bacterium]
MKPYLNSSLCACGKIHKTTVDEVIIASGAIDRIPAILQKYTVKKVFVLSDINTYMAAAERVCALLSLVHLPFSQYSFPDENLKPDERSVGSALMHFDNDCNFIIAVGSGVINDIGKILSQNTGNKYMIVATAPSMDGYASATSSMIMNGLKISINSQCPNVIIGDIDVLRQAPEPMLKAGLGDMLAKYVSITEWRISHLINNEYYCPVVAELIRSSLKNCVDNATGLLNRESTAIAAVFEGLVTAGMAMTYTGVSRPASGVEHYFSHVWDMRGLEFGTKTDLHGIQCAMGTSITVRLYEILKTFSPNSEKAFHYVNCFCYENWCQELKRFLGNSAETMIALEAQEQKYSKSAHKARYHIIEENWNSILKILNEELPDPQKLKRLLDTIGISDNLSSLDITSEIAALTFKTTKDIRDKYILSRLAWDLGILDDLCDFI